MVIREIAKARLSLQNAGTLADRNRLRSTLISHLENDIRVFEQEKAIVRDDYRRKLERWRTEEVSENVPVCALPSDIHDSRLYRVTGVFALCCEMALAAWVFQWLGVGWWMGVLMALGITTTLHGIFLHVFDDRERPKESICRIKTFASRPAIFGFLVALALGVLARYVNGSLAVLLLPAFSLALWLGTLSLLILAASLLTVAHIQSWSARYETQNRKLDHEQRVSSVFLNELQADDGSTAVIPRTPGQAFGAAASADNASSAAKRRMGFLASGVIAAALISGTGCAPATSASTPQPQVEPSAVGADLDIFLDTSGSCVRPAFQESWNTVARELPELIERYEIKRLAVWQFDEDGWSPQQLREIALPDQRLPAHSRIAGTEWESFANIREAMREADEQEWRRRVTAEKEQYRQRLASALKGLDAEHVLPDANYKTAQTDIVGLLRRVSQRGESEPEYVIILTDLADTQYRTLPKLPLPQSQLRVLLLLVPAQPKDARMTLGKALPGPEQFDIRVHQLQNSAQWISVAPYFARNLAELFADSQTR